MSERTLATATHVRAWPPTALNAKRIHYIMIKQNRQSKQKDVEDDANNLLTANMRAVFSWRNCKHTQRTS